MKQTAIFVFTIQVSIMLCMCGSTVAENGDDTSSWHQYRGPNSQGFSVDTVVPLSWDQTKNVRWRTALPHPGNSSPIVYGEKIFITISDPSGQSRAIHCYDRSNGKKLWEKVVNHPVVERLAQNFHCSPTPCTDGQRVIAWLGSAGVYCLDLDGNELWNRNLGKFSSTHGYSSSPIIYKNSVILHSGPAQSFLIALDKATGETLWKQNEPRKKDFSGSFSTPVIATVNGNDLLLVSYVDYIKAHNPNSGEPLWRLDGVGEWTYTSIAIDKTMGVAIYDSYKKQKSMGFKLVQTAEAAKEAILWNESYSKSQTSTGFILDGVMYNVDDLGRAYCMEVATGKHLWRTRLPSGNRGAFSSLVYAAGRLYITTRRGVTIVFKPSSKGLEVLAVNEMGEKCHATMAISRGEIFIRTFDALYCIATEAQQTSTE